MHVDAALKKVCTLPRSDESLFVRARVIGNYDSLYEKCKKLQKAKNKYEDIQYINEMENI